MIATALTISSLFQNPAAVAQDTSAEISDLNKKGNELVRLDDNRGAIEAFDKALAIDPNDVESLNGKAGILGILGDYAGADEYLDRVLAIDPNDATANLGKSIVLEHLEVDG